MFDQAKFRGKVALVTGGRNGIGRATAIEFARMGAKVAVADRVEDHETADIIRSNGGTCFFVQCDISDTGDIHRMINMVTGKYGGLDFAFNHSEIDNDESIEELSLCRASVRLRMKYEIAYMLDHGGGSIVNTTFMPGMRDFQGLPTYVSGRHGIIGLSKPAAREYARKGIRINTICHGVITTPMGYQFDKFNRNIKEIEQRFEAPEHIGRSGQSKEVAEAVAWLCSDSASFLAGHTMAVDGDWATP